MHGLFRGGILFLHHDLGGWPHHRADEDDWDKAPEPFRASMAMKGGRSIFFGVFVASVLVEAVAHQDKDKGANCQAGIKEDEVTIEGCVDQGDGVG